MNIQNVRAADLIASLSFSPVNDKTSQTNKSEFSTQLSGVTSSDKKPAQHKSLAQNALSAVHKFAHFLRSLVTTKQADNHKSDSTPTVNVYQHHSLVKVKDPATDGTRQPRTSPGVNNETTQPANAAVRRKRQAPLPPVMPAPTQGKIPPPPPMPAPTQGKIPPPPPMPSPAQGKIPSPPPMPSLAQGKIPPPPPMPPSLTAAPTAKANTSTSIQDASTRLKPVSQDQNVQKPAADLMSELADKLSARRAGIAGKDDTKSTNRMSNAAIEIAELKRQLGPEELRRQAAAEELFAAAEKRMSVEESNISPLKTEKPNDFIAPLVLDKKGIPLPPPPPPPMPPASTGNIAKPVNHAAPKLNHARSVDALNDQRNSQLMDELKDRLAKRQSKIMDPIATPEPDREQTRRNTADIGDILRNHADNFLNKTRVLD